MKKLLILPAYLWAVACFLLIPATFVKNDTFARQLAGLSFMKVHPVYSGGELNREYEHDSMLIRINKPVNTSLFGNGSREIVQVTFSASGALPEQIHQFIDYDFDNHPDFEVTISTPDGKTGFTALQPAVKSLGASSKVKENWIIRVNLKNE